MQPVRLNILFTAMILTAALGTTTVSADYQQVITDSEGFCINLRSVNNHLLAERIRQNRKQLQQTESEFQAKLDRQAFTQMDIVLTAALPGGLLYAAFKRAAQIRTHNKLEYVAHEISQLSAELRSLESIAHDLPFAALDRLVDNSPVETTSKLSR